MSAPTLASLLQGFFTDRLITQRQASPQTISAYRDALRLLLLFAAQRARKQPVRLLIDDVGPDTVAAFLDHLETHRGNTSTTRNARLAAIHSFYRYALPFIPDRAHTVSQVLAIPPRRRSSTIVHYLTAAETQALLEAPDRATWFGRRDHGLLVLAAQTGLRLSEITGLKVQDLILASPGAAVRTTGKGRRQRATPLTGHTLKILRTWLHELAAQPEDPVFVTHRGHQMSQDAVQRLVAKHAATAAATCPSIGAKKVTPHTLRHTAAMALMTAGVDTSVIALWLGHQSPMTTQIYLHADMATKEKALAKVTSPKTAPGRYKPDDALITFLEHL